MYTGRTNFLVWRTRHQRLAGIGKSGRWRLPVRNQAYRVNELYAANSALIVRGLESMRDKPEKRSGATRTSSMNKKTKNKNSLYFSSACVPCPHYLKRLPGHPLLFYICLFIFRQHFPKVTTERHKTFGGPFYDADVNVILSVRIHTLVTRFCSRIIVDCYKL